MRGWILDCYPDEENDSIVIWLRQGKGTKRIEEKYRPSFYAWADEAHWDHLLASLDMGNVEHTVEKKSLWLGEAERDVVRIFPRHFSDLMPLAKSVDRWGRYRDHRLFNVDMRMDMRFLLSHGIFPMGLLETDPWKNLDSPFRIDYPLPDLKMLHLEADIDAPQGIPTMQDRLRSVTLDKDTVDGAEDEILEGLRELVRQRDPDIIHTEGGDGFLLPYLQARAELNGVDLVLGREGGMRKGRGKSYFTYGRIVHKPTPHRLKGRVHIDANAAFIFSEGGLHGIIDLARMGCIPLQEMSRLSPGTAISSMQMTEAMRQGTLIMWKKNLPEGFKTAAHLVASDRGGFIYDPKPGIYGHVAEVDFASLYPSIMVVHNISPETLLCSCCPDSRRRVPELNYWTCEKREGLLPIVLRPIIQRRLALKRLAKAGARHKDVYTARAKALKWLLVTCFGYTGYKNARFGRIECHEAINAYGREILLQASEIAERRGFHIIHGIVDSLWLQGNGDANALCRDISARVSIPLMLEGIYDWIVFLPNVTNGAGALNRYYGSFTKGEAKVRGIALRRSDTPEFMRELQRAMLGRLCQCKDPESFVEALPQVVDIALGYVGIILDGAAKTDDLMLTKRVSRPLAEYRQKNESYAALTQMHELGFELAPGQKVRYLACEDADRVKVEDFIDGSEVYDRSRYADLALRAASEMISPFGYDLDEMRNIMGKAAGGLWTKASSRPRFRAAGGEQAALCVPPI